MAEHIKLIELDFDIDRLKKNMTAVNKDVEDLTERQKLLKKSSVDLGVEIEKKIALMKKAEASNATNTASYSKLKKEVEQLRDVQKLSTKERRKQLVETKSSLKSIRKEEQLMMRAIDAHTQKEKKKLVVIKQTDGSIDQLSAALSQNRALYKSLTKEQRENSQIGKKLLDIIGQQDEEYKKLNNEMGVTQVNVGNYKDEMKKAIAESFNLQQAMTSLLGRFGVFVPFLLSGYNGLKKFALGNKTAAAATGLTSKALRVFRVALAATGIGAILLLIGALVTGFMGIKSAMNRSEKSANKVRRVFSAITGIFNLVLKALEPLGEYLIDGLVAGFEAVSIVADKTMNLLEKGLAFIGWDSAAKSVENFNNNIKKGVKDAQDLADAEAKLAQAERESEKTKLDYQKRAEKFRQIRDDENLSIKERIKANEDLGNVLKEQLREELKIAQLALNAANLRIKAEGETTELLDQRSEVLTRISDIQDRITGQESEQLTNRVSLQKEATEKLQKRIDAELKASKTKIDIYIAENKDKAKTLDGLLKYEEIVHKKKLDLLKSELKNKKKTQEEYDLAVLNQKKEFAKRQAEIVSEHASKELDIYIAQHKSKIDSEKALTNDLVKAEEDRLQTIYNKKVAILEQQKSDGLISEQDYLFQKLQLQGEHLTAVKELEKGFNEQKKEQKAIDEENDKALKEIALEDELLSLQEKEDLKNEIKLSSLQKQKDAEIEKAVKTGADIGKINKKYNALEEKENKRHAKAKENIDKASALAKLQVANAVFGVMGELVGKETAAGKAIAIAQAGINSYLAASKALATYAYPLGGIMAGVAYAQGAIQVAKIAGIGVPKKDTKANVPKLEKGGAVFPIGGNRHSAGGTKFYGEDGTAFEAEKDEVLIVLNRAASSAFAGLSELNARHGGNAFNQTHRYLAGGGLVGRNSSITTVTTNNNAPGIDYDLLAQKIVEGNKSLPHPVTLVQDIIHETNIHNEIIDGSKF